MRTSQDWRLRPCPRFPLPPPSAAIWVYPVLVFVTVMVNCFFVIFKGAKNVAHWKADKAAWVAACVAAGCMLLAAFPGMWLLRRLVRYVPR